MLNRPRPYRSMESTAENMLQTGVSAEKNNAITHAAVGCEANGSKRSAVQPEPPQARTNAVYRRTIPSVRRDLIMLCDRSAGSQHVYTSTMHCRNLKQDKSETNLKHSHYVYVQLKREEGHMES